MHAVANSKEGPRVWYRGRILVPIEVDADVDVAEQSMRVSVDAVDPNLDYVDISISRSRSRGISLLQYTNDQDAGVSGEETIVTIPCGRVHTGTYYLRRVSRFEPSIYGFGGANDGTTGINPIISWTVGTTAIPDGIRTIPITTENGSIVSIDCNLDPLTRILTLTAKPADGTYRAKVVCRVSEPDGSNPLSAEETFHPIGVYTGINKMDRVLLEECMSRIVQFFHLRPRDLLVPPQPDPWLGFNVHRIKIQNLVDVLQKIDPAAAKQLAQMTDLRFGDLKPH